MSRPSARKPSHPSPASTPSPEHWSADAGSRGVAQLDIPADAERERRFEVFCQLAVKATRPDARHGMRVLVDGALEWERSVATHPDGGDTLELRLTRTVPAGRPLRISASCTLHGGAQRTRLRVTADEE